MYNVKVIDFGYSTRYTEDNPSIQVPISEPWNAPEHGRLERMWTPSEAKKLDCFSFGFLCLWILFEEDLKYDHEKPVTTLMELKQEGNLPLVAQQRLEAEQTFDDNMKCTLQGFFNSTLDQNQAKRQLSYGGLFKGQAEGHNPCQNLRQQLQEIDLCLSDADFKVSLTYPSTSARTECIQSLRRLLANSTHVTLEFAHTSQHAF